MTEFYDYVREQKQAASGARHRVCGSKSKRCYLPSDHMTQAQWKKKNGEVVSVNLSQPMNWAAFSGMANDLKEEYITKCIADFGCGLSDFSRMFGVHAITVKRHFQKAGINTDCFHSGKRMTKEQRCAFDKWLGMEEEKPISVEEQAVQPQPVVDHADAMNSCTRISMTFDGLLDYVAILKAVYQFAGDQPVCMNITIDKRVNHEQI